MPLDPNHIHADTPHARTVHLASQGWRYGCHSAQTGDETPRGGITSYLAHPWRYGGPAFVETEWLPVTCGHDLKATDAACEGCVNRGEK